MKLKSLASRLKRSSDRLAMREGWRAHDVSAHARGYGREWQAARLEFLAANPLCIHCQESGRVQASRVVDHIVPHCGDRRLFWDRDNWQALCIACHNGWKQRIDHAMKYGRDAS